MNACTVVAYAYDAEILCPACMRRVAAGKCELHGMAADYVPLSDLLDAWAAFEGWGMEADTADFPAPVFSDQCASDETCAACLERIL